jgi:hypothetical protein
MATLRTYVYVTTRFEGFHRWENAPDDVAFLRDWHRHAFHVKMEVRVGHNDREVEFFQLKRKLEVYLREYWTDKRFEASCEMIAHEIRDEFVKQGYFVSMVDVSEDGENGAVVTTWETNDE